jgi:hypothetical protein
MIETKAPPKPLTARAAAIVKEWNDGASAADLAAMHKVSRSSILGTIHRAKKEGHHVVSKTPAGNAQRPVAPKPKRLERVRDSSRVPARAPIPRAQLEDEGDMAIDPNASRYADRQAKMRVPGAADFAKPFSESGNTCIWPLWDASSRTGHVCGLAYRIAPDERGQMRPKGPDCEFHHGTAYPGGK